MRIVRRGIVAGAAAALATCVVGSGAPRRAAAQGGPSGGQAVRLVLPFPPGNQVDIVARRLAEALRQAWGAPVIVENRPGAAGALALGHVARAAPDGLTLLASSLSPLVVTPAVNRSLPYDTERDFAPVALLGFNDVVLVGGPQLPANSLRELVEWLRGRAEPLPYASIGIGTLGHLAMELLGTRAGLRLQHVPYNGSAQAYTDLFRGDVALMVDGMPQAMAQVRAGRLKALAVLATRRSAFAPDLPTVGEAGLPGLDAIEVTGWSGLLAPAATPPALVARLNADVQVAMAEPAMQDYLRAQGLSGYPRHAPADMARFIADELAKWREVARAAGVTTG